MIRIFPPGTVLSALNPATVGPELSTCLSDVSLSADLQRQSRHIAFEFMRLREIRFRTNGPDSGGCDITQEAVTERLDGLFLDLLKNGAREEDVAGEAKLAESTLREVRTLYDKEHFFTKPMYAFYRAFTLLSPDYDQFGAELFQNLYHYRRRRDEDQRKFMEKFVPFAREIQTIIENIGQGFNFSYFKIELRIKTDLLEKMRKRAEEENWTDMTRFYDLIGLRIIVGDQKEVDAAVALVEGAMKLHEAAARSSEGWPHYFRVDNVETKDNDRGYRAKHINVVRTRNGKAKNYATAEIQVMSRGIKEWGDIQRLLVYKDDEIPDSLKDDLKVHCRAAADYIVRCETQAVPNEKPPEFDIMALNRIPDEKLMNDVFDRLADMQKLMADYQDRSLSLPEVEEPPPSQGR